MTEKIKSMSQLQKQMLIISLCAAFFAVLILLYFFVLKPIIDKLNEPVTTFIEDIKDDPDKKRLFKNTKGETILTLLPGEDVLTFGENHRILVTPKVERSEVKNVAVKNHEDNYKLIHHLGQNFYYVEGAELTPINQEIIANFFTNIGYLLSMERVAAKNIDDGNEILADLEAFGLNPEDPNIYFIVTTTGDVWYKVIIGDKIPTTGGYYVMYEDKDGLRPAIYILDTMMEDTILKERYAIMLPIISNPIPQNEILFATNFKFYKGFDLMIDIYNAPIPEGSEALVNYQMTYPERYPVSDNYSSLMMAFTGFTGESVVYAYSPADEISEEILLKYGFDELTAKITFEHNEQEYYFIFSKPNEKGNYYVLTEFCSIVEITPDMLRRTEAGQPFIEWDWLKFVDKAIFSENINGVESILVKVPGKEDALFTLEGTRDELEVRGNGKILDVPTFRSYYIALLSIEIIDSETTAVEKEDLLLLELKIVNRDGTIRDYSFYFVENNTRRSYYRLNDRADFYVLRDKVLKLAADTEKMLQNEFIERDAME